MKSENEKIISENEFSPYSGENVPRVDDRMKFEDEYMSRARPERNIRTRISFCRTRE